MTNRLVAIAVIFIGASLAWLILGGTLSSRTADSDSKQRNRIATQWGRSQTQDAPRIWADVGKKTIAVPVVQSRVAVGLNLTQRRDGLLWYNLYSVQFSGRYRVRNTSTVSHLRLEFPLPATGGDFSNLRYSIAGRQIDNATALSRGSIDLDLQPGAETEFDVEYGSRGTDDWRYQIADKSVESLTDFELTMDTNFEAIDFPPETLLPTSEERTPDGGHHLIWRYATLVTSNDIGMTVPYPLQPGPLAQRITFWAPVALLFYFFVMLMITTLRGFELHPMNYFFLAAAFFAFHLLFAYLVDRIPLEIAFAICSIVSIFLTVSYLRLVVGWRFAALESGLAQLVYLVLFSYALFNEGWSGLTITIGAIITLFVAMQLTGRRNWDEAYAR